MVIQKECSPLCNPSKILSFNNGYENLIFCGTCSLLKKEDKSLELKVINLPKFNYDVEEFISTQSYKNQILECKSQLKKIFSITKTKKNKALDFGCGYGSFMFACKDLGLTVHGYDINKNFTENLAKYFKTFDSKKNLLNQDNINGCDIIFCRQVLNLSPNVYNDFKIFDQLLSSSGVLVILDHVKNFSKYKSIITQNNNNTVLLTTQSIEFYANNFGLKKIYLKNDFGDMFSIFMRSQKIDYKGKISLNLLIKLEKFSFFFMFLSKFKQVIKNIYYGFKNKKSSFTK